jgi:hypothetical protein
MPFTAIAVQEAKQTVGGIGFGPLLSPVVFTTNDSVNGNMFLNDGKTILIINNPLGAIWSASIITVSDNYGRLDTALQSFNIGIGGYAFVGPLDRRIWNQRSTDTGYVYVSIPQAGLKLAAIRLGIGIV